MAHWLVKSEPNTYSFADLQRDGRTVWDGVRNNAAALHLKAMKLGDEVRVRIGPYEHRIVVRSTSDRRGPATVAATLYDELPESRATREALMEQRRMEIAAGADDAGRPSKRDRRQIEQLRKRRD